jgi:hypothetical protein
VFYLRYSAAELRRRRGRTILTLLGPAGCRNGRDRRRAVQWTRRRPDGGARTAYRGRHFNPAARNFGDIADGFTSGLRGVFFLVSRPSERPAAWSPLVEVLWLACERPTPQIAVLQPSWQVSSLQELIDAVSI